MKRAHNDILSFFPYDTIRTSQEEVLQTIQDTWDQYDGYYIVAPTAFGKTPVADTLARWSPGTARIIAPNNLLVDQLAEGTGLPGLRGYDTYRCHAPRARSAGLSCKAGGARCRGCPLAAAQSDWFGARAHVTNYHMHHALLQQNKYRNSPDVLIVDEAHNLIPFLQDQYKFGIWKHQYRFPRDESPTSLRRWLEDLPTHAPASRIGRHAALLEDMKGEWPNLVLSTEQEIWRAGGKDRDGTRMSRGEDYLLDQLVAKPLDISRYGEEVWTDRTQKVILLSATISRRDILDLGLARKRMLRIECEHPIPTTSRPIIYDPVASVNHTDFPGATKAIAEHITEHLLPHHVGEKGLIHATYEQARLFRQFLTDPRFVFHDHASKTSVYERWRASDPSEGQVLVASGMYEGLDLPEDLGRWQVLAKIPWPSLLEPAIAAKADQDEEWYSWTTLKDTIQAAGRICRTPEDYGVTYILDSSYARLLDHPLVPEWFNAAMVRYDLGEVG